MQLVWFKRDLRTHDHRPLVEAASLGPVLPLYVVEPGYWAQPDTSARQWTAAAGAVQDLAARLTHLGAPLIVRQGDVVDILARIHKALPISGLWAHEETGNDWTFGRDRAVHAFCRRAGIPFTEYPQFGVVRRLKSRDEWGRAHNAFMTAPIVPEPSRLTPATTVPSLLLPSAADLGLLPDGCEAPQDGTRTAALELFRSFAAGRGAGYRREMSSPVTAARACSRLSVALSLGTLSIREAMQLATEARRALAREPIEARSVPLTALDSLTSRLHWHCHFIQKLESEPALEWRSVHPLHEDSRVATRADDPNLEAWATGRTGFPFVDACMRSLIATGWLTFRMRAMVMSFAAYHLALDWRMAGLRLARLFTDYEPGIHWPQVQMQAGATGINTPRMYNPVKQAQDQDPTGAFTRQWVPELKDVPLAYLHEPWRMDQFTQNTLGIAIGRDYPAPLVDHVEAVRAARARLSELRHGPGYQQAARAVFTKHGSRTRKLGQDDTPKRAQAKALAKAEKAAQQLSFEL